MSNQANFQRFDRANGRTLAVAGELDLAVGTQFADELTLLVAEAHSPAFVDLSGCTFMDSTGINALLTAREHGAAHGVPLVVAAASPACRRVLEVCGVWDLLQAHS